MTKWEARCTGCGCWRIKGVGYCLHKCEICKDKITDLTKKTRRAIL